MPWLPEGQGQLSGPSGDCLHSVAYMQTELDHYGHHRNNSRSLGLTPDRAELTRDEQV